MIRFYGGLEDFGRAALIVPVEVGRIDKNSGDQPEHLIRIIPTPSNDSQKTVRHSLALNLKEISQLHRLVSDIHQGMPQRVVRNRWQFSFKRSADGADLYIEHRDGSKFAPVLFEIDCEPADCLKGSEDLLLTYADILDLHTLTDQTARYREGLCLSPEANEYSHVWRFASTDESYVVCKLCGDVLARDFAPLSVWLDIQKKLSISDYNGSRA